MDALYEALRRVQSPFDIALNHVWQEHATMAAVKTLIDAGLWQKWVTHGGQPSTSKQLSEITGIDSVLICRLLRELAGQKLVTETGKDTYALTDYAKALAEPQFSSLYGFLYGVIQPCFANFPKFAAETKYTNPTDSNHTNFQSWQGAGQTVFTMLSARPDLGVHFNNAMTNYSNSKTAWTDIYPTDRLIIDGAKPDRALVVDVGGGNGHDLEKFRAKHPDVPHGSLVLQDLPKVVEAAEQQQLLRSPCVAQAYDFFTPQPVQGARVYYIHCALHDWADSQAVEILKNLASAMEKGYSRILLHEVVIAPENAHRQTTMSDLVMMMCLSAAERSEEMWRDLIRQAGLKVSKIWTVPQSFESVIEVELP